MKKLKIVLLSSVLAISLGQAASAAYSQEQLTTLRALVESGNTGAVMAYINANSDLLTRHRPPRTGAPGIHQQPRGRSWRHLRPTDAKPRQCPRCAVGRFFG